MTDDIMALDKPCKQRSKIKIKGHNEINEWNEITMKCFYILCNLQRKGRNVSGWTREEISHVGVTTKKANPWVYCDVGTDSPIQCISRPQWHGLCCFLAAGSLLDVNFVLGKFQQWHWVNSGLHQQYPWHVFALMCMGWTGLRRLMGY